jgi:cell division protein DivIC
MSRFSFIQKLPAIFRNKYILTIAIFFAWLLLIDPNNLISRVKDMSDLHNLRKEKEYFEKKVEVDKKKIKELKTDNNNLEKFAREQYLMKKPDEDLFIVLTPSEDRKISRRNN